jgi:lactoylglutathione lyase
MRIDHIALWTTDLERCKRLRDDGFAILDGPRSTGDGYYESVVLDPDGNRVEITA